MPRGAPHLAAALAAVAGLPALLPGCAADVPGQGDVTVRGTLVDDETGRPVPRTTIWVHAFDDAAQTHATLDPGDDAAFELRTTSPQVRLRVADMSHEYALWERTLTAQDGVVAQEVRLTPTHRVRLHGRVLFRDGDRLRPPSQGDGNVRHAFLAFGGDGTATGSVIPAGDGSYSVRVPRTVLRVFTIDTNRSANPSEVDLTDVQGDDRALDIVLE